MEIILKINLEKIMLLVLFGVYSCYYMKLLIEDYLDIKSVFRVWECVWRGDEFFL